MICIEILSICYVCYVHVRVQIQLAGLSWDSIAITESGHVSSLPFHVSLYLQCRCWIVLRIVNVSTSRCTQGWCTFLAAAPGSNNFHPWLTVIQFTGQGSNLLNHPTISLCYFWCLILFCCLRDMSWKAHPWAFAAKIILILRKTWNGTRLSKSSEEWFDPKTCRDKSWNLIAHRALCHLFHSSSLRFVSAATCSDVFWTRTKAFSLQLVRAFGRWPRVDHRFPSAPIGANSCAEPAHSKRVTFWGLLILLVGCCCHCIAWHWPYRTSGLPRQALGGNRVGSICHLNCLRCHNMLHLFYSVPLHTCSHTVIWCDLAWHDLKWCEEDTSLSTMQAADLRRPAMKHHETICEFILYHPTRPTTMINYLLRSLLQSVNIIQYL